MALISNPIRSSQKGTPKEPRGKPQVLRATAETPNQTLTAWGRGILQDPVKGFRGLGVQGFRGLGFRGLGV